MKVFNFKKTNQKLDWASHFCGWMSFGKHCLSDNENWLMRFVYQLELRSSRLQLVIGSKWILVCRSSAHTAWPHVALVWHSFAFTLTKTTKSRSVSYHGKVQKASIFASKSRTNLNRRKENAFLASKTMASIRLATSNWTSVELLGGRGEAHEIRSVALFLRIILIEFDFKSH